MEVSSTEVAAAGAGAAAGAAVAEGVHFFQSQVNQYKSDKLNKQMDVINLVWRQSMKGERLSVTAKAGELQLDLSELRSVTPAYTQMKLAFDAILTYQKHRTRAIPICPVCLSSKVKLFAPVPCKCCAPKDRYAGDPRTLVLELLKCWIRENIEVRDLYLRDLMAYRNFCRSFVVHRHVFIERNKLSFIWAMSQVAIQLEEILPLRLKESQNARQVFDRLLHEYHAYILNSVKVLFFGATNFTIPATVYSIDSLQMLQRTAVSAEFLRGEDKKVAEQMAPHWQTDCGQLIRVLLQTPQMSALIARSAANIEQGSQLFGINVLRAENLPSALHTITACVEVTVKRATQTLAKMRTSIKKHDENPTWEEWLFFEWPRADDGNLGDCMLSIEIVDCGVGELSCACTEQLSLEQVKAAVNEKELRLELKAVSGLMSRTVNDSRVFVQIVVPTFTMYHDMLKQKWNSQNRTASDMSETSTDRSGLLFWEVGASFLDSAATLEHVTYFLDLLVGECGEIARLMGDLGMVMVKDILQPLLEEVEQRCSDTEAAVMKINDAVYKIRIEQTRNQETDLISDIIMGDSERERAYQVASTSLTTVRDLKRRLGVSFAELREVFTRYGSAEGALEDGKAKYDMLMQHMHDSETLHRSNKLTKAIQSKSNHAAFASVAALKVPSI